MAKAVGDEVVRRDLVPAFVKLLKDSEAEVRTAIAGQIPGKLIPEFYGMGLTDVFYRQDSADCLTVKHF